MPLDTQPLSPARRILLLAVLLLFFVASLAFAQYLVTRRQKHSFVTADFAPFGFTTPAPAIHPDEVAARTAAIHNLPRRLDLFVSDQDAPLTPDQQIDAAGNVFIEMMNVVPQTTGPARLAGYDAAQAAGIAPTGRFAVVRLSQIRDHLVAICYSGPGPYTDADKAVFAAICNNGLRFSKTP